MRWSRVSGTGRRLHQCFRAAVHGGLGRARRLRAASLRYDAVDDPGVDCLHGLRTSIRTAVACVRFTAAPCPDGAAYQIAIRPVCSEGRRSLRAALAGLPPRGGSVVTGPKMHVRLTLETRRRAPEAVLVRRLGQSPGCRPFPPPGRGGTGEREDPNAPFALISQDCLRSVSQTGTKS